MMITLAELGVLVAGGFIGLLGGHPVGAAWKAVRVMFAVFPNRDRAEMTPEERERLEQIEDSFDTPAGRAGADMGR